MNELAETIPAQSTTPELKPDPFFMTPEIQQKYDTIRSIGEECVSENELKSLLIKKVGEQKSTFNLYDGFEPSGRVHIAQGAFKAVNVNKCTSSGGVFIFWVADWFALMNDKMGGDLDKIKTVGQYLIEVWTAAGMDMSDNKVLFKWASDEITNNAATYWPKMLDIARRFNITRIKKCCQIMGRLEGNLTAAQILYPLMQCTDVFFLKADVCQLGVDQRKVNMLAREYCDAANIKFKPVILSHHMLYGLKAGQEKMSKSDPDSAIFMEDSPEDVDRKIMAAYCPRVAAGIVKPKDTNDDAGKESMQLVEDDLKNPCLDYVKNIVLCPENSTFSAGGKIYTDFEAVKYEFVNEILSENDLKKGLIDAINLILEPVRNHFESNEHAKDLLAKIHAYKNEPTTLVRTFRRLDALEHNVVPADSHVVFVQAPNCTPSLQLAVDIIIMLQAKPSDSTMSVLFYSDWSAIVQGACNADVKVIDYYYEVLTNSLITIAPEIMKNVVIVKQSAAILKDPSNYWISVINAGRYFPLNVVQEGYEDFKPVGNVIARLMLVADAISLSPKSIAFISSDTNSIIETIIIKKYFEEANIPLPVPILISVERINILLQNVDALHATENSEYFLLDDAKVNGKPKIKKSFCEEGNLEFNPCISLTNFFIFILGVGNVEILRSEENGGNVIYSSIDSIKSDFAQHKLHPGDLKEYISKVMVELFTKLNADTKANKSWTAAGKGLKAFEKKISKKN